MSQSVCWTVGASLKLQHHQSARREAKGVVMISFRDAEVTGMWIVLRDERRGFGWMRF